VNIEIAGEPEAAVLPDRPELCIRIPLTATPDDVLIDALENSPQISSFCERLEPYEDGLLIYPKGGNSAGMGTALTAIQQLLALTNNQRAERLMSEEERAAKALEEERRQVAAELKAWWEGQGQAP
jgi:hypothetical protein